jgi:hypothetical protein
MKDIEERFSKYLINVIFPSNEQKENEHWNVSGIIKNNSNQNFKFDVRPMFNMPNNQLGKKIKILSKADKIVFETEKEWIIIDAVEFNEYVKKQVSKIIQFEDLIKKLEWNMYILKI